MLMTTLMISLLLVGESAAVKVYPFPMDPRDHPDYTRYFVKHPTQSTFGNTVQFATLRGFAIDDNSTVVDYTDALKQYCLDPQTSVGAIIWPTYSLLFTTNFNDVVDAIQSSDLYVTDIWGFVPGSGPGNGSLWRENFPQQFYPTYDALGYLESSLGEKWLGMDVGEQDGRYIGGYSDQMTPSSSSRQDQYINFRDYSRGMEDILGPKLVALISLTYPHYMIRSGLYTMVGAEAAQALPNSQVFYAFVRGAGKQYGVLWFGNVSVYNRFGYKTYPAAFKHVSETVSDLLAEKSKSGVQYECTSQNDGGPTCGTSLNLMKRLMYAHIMYGSSYVSFESGWFLGSTTTFSPIGHIQYGAKQFIEREGPQGVHSATMALFLDFFTGLCPPRHLYTGNHYRSWGNLPYSEGDYLADNVLRLVYPQYQDSSYFHDETGFSSPTPYGDSLDVLLSDAASWLLAEYDTIIVASNITGSLEVKENLEDFVFNNKGNLVITAGNLAQFSGGLLGISTKLLCVTFSAGEKVYLPNKTVVTEPNGMCVCDLSFPSNSSTIARLGDGTPLAVQLTFGTGGSLTVLATPFGLSSSVVSVPEDKIDVSYDTPYPLLEHVQWVINNVLTNAALFTSSSNLSIAPAYRDINVFNVLVTNPELKEQPFVLLSPQGVVTIIREILLDQSEKGQVGYLPDGYSGTDIGNSTDTTIAGGDTRLFVVSLSSSNIQLLPKSTPKPRPVGIALHLHRVKYSIRNEVLLRPTFFQHYDSVVVDCSYISGTDTALLMDERNWLKQQNITIYVDGSSSIDLFPHLRMVNNSFIAFNASMQYFLNLIAKMAVLGSHDVILSLHRVPENYITLFETLSSFNDTLRFLLGQAMTLGINVHIRDTLKNPLDTLALSGWLQACGLSEIKVGLNTGILFNKGFNSDIQSIVATQASFVFITAPSYDIFGQLYSENTPLAGAVISTQQQILGIITKICILRGYCPYSPTNIKYPLVLDGDYSSFDDEYLDVKMLENTLLGANFK